MFFILCMIITFLLGWICVERYVLRHEGFEQIPGPKGIFLLENTLQFIMDPVKMFYYFRSLCNQYKYLFKVKVGGKKFVIIHNPEDIELIISGTKNMSKGYMYKFLKPWLQEGLLLSEGAKWLQRRKILTPAFHFNVLRCFGPVFEENSRRLVENLNSEVGKPATNITAHISDFTLNSICETAMGSKLDAFDSGNSIRYKNAIHGLGQIIVHRGQRVWMYLNWMFSLTQTGKKQNEHLNMLTNFRNNVINKRREERKCNNNLQLDVCTEDVDGDFLSGKKRLAMLDLLLEAEKDGVIDGQGIGEEVDTFMFEGHDTTATALQFTLMLLANNPDTQDKAMEELEIIFSGSDRPPSMADVGRMKYLECCVKESLRLFPPVFFVMRTIDQNIKLKHYGELYPGLDCAILIFDLHRRDDQFVDPQKFDPERFLREPTWHPYSYIPFSAGPRNCIGQKFAMLEMKMVLSTVLRKYRFLPVTKPQDVVFITDFVLRPNHPLYVQIEKRQ